MSVVVLLIYVRNMEKSTRPKKSQRSNLLNHSFRVFWLTSLLSIFRLADQTSVFLRSCFTETPYKFISNLMLTVNSNLKWLSHRGNRLNIFCFDFPVTHFLDSAKDSIKPFFPRWLLPHACSTLPPSLSPLCFLFPVPMFVSVPHLFKLMFRVGVQVKVKLYWAPSDSTKIKGRQLFIRLGVCCPSSNECLEGRFT